MALTPGQHRTLFGWFRAAVPTNLIPDRFQAVLRDKDLQKEFKKDFGSLLSKWFGRVNPYKDDKTETQKYFFDHKGRVKPIKEQIELLESVYLVGCKVDEAYVAQRLSEPTPRGFVKVAVPKLTFLERHLRPADLPTETEWTIWDNIGLAIEHVTDVLKTRRPTFENYRKGELGAKHLRVHAESAERRRADEALVPGDIMICDVHMNNLLGSQQVCHTSRWSREEVLIDDSLMGLSAVDGNWILVVNEELQTKNEDLAWDYTLEEYCVAGVWSYSLCSGFSDRLGFNGGLAGAPGCYYAALVAVRPGKKLDT